MHHDFLDHSHDKILLLGSCAIRCQIRKGTLQKKFLNQKKNFTAPAGTDLCIHYQIFHFSVVVFTKFWTVSLTTTWPQCPLGAKFCASHANCATQKLAKICVVYSGPRFGPRNPSSSSPIRHSSTDIFRISVLLGPFVLARLIGVLKSDLY